MNHDGMPSPDGTDPDDDLSQVMTAEVAAFVIRGLTPDAACELVGIDRSELVASLVRPPEYLPTPEEIEAACDLIRERLPPSVLRSPVDVPILPWR